MLKLSDLKISDVNGRSHDEFPLLQGWHDHRGLYGGRRSSDPPDKLGCLLYHLLAEVLLSVLFHLSPPYITLSSVDRLELLIRGRCGGEGVEGDVCIGVPAGLVDLFFVSMWLGNSEGSRVKVRVYDGLLAVITYLLRPVVREHGGMVPKGKTVDSCGRVGAHANDVDDSTAIAKEVALVANLKGVVESKRVADGVRVNELLLLLEGLVLQRVVTASVVHYSGMLAG